MTRPARNLRVAAVVDAFTAACLAPEVRLLSVDARIWRLQLAAFRPHLLFVESAWRGRAGSWTGKVARYPGRPRSRTLDRVVDYCRARGIPTVFWGKEDPVLFDRFVDAARLFDVVFTTDADCVDAYVARCGLPPDRVHPLPFAAQPALHYPPRGPRTDTVCFAGSYGEPEFADRRRHLDMLLDAAADFDLVIYDRNSAAKTAHKAFPPRFARYLRPAIDYRRLADEYRRHKVFLNVNSVATSPTMFARRVFELLACGTAVVSTPSVGMERLFGGVVAVARSTDEARRAIRRFLSDDDYRDAVAAEGIERVRSAHTYAHRVDAICRAVGLA